MGDFNGDGVQDLLWREHSGNQTHLFTTLMSGNQGIAATFVGSFNDGDFENFEPFTTTELNGDATTDMVFQVTDFGAPTAGAVIAWNISNGGIASTAVMGSAGPDWSIIA